MSNIIIKPVFNNYYHDSEDLSFILKTEDKIEQNSLSKKYESIVFKIGENCYMELTTYENDFKINNIFFLLHKRMDGKHEVGIMYNYHVVKQEMDDMNERTSSYVIKYGYRIKPKGDYDFIAEVELEENTDFILECSKEDLDKMIQYYFFKAFKEIKKKSELDFTNIEYIYYYLPRTTLLARFKVEGENRTLTNLCSKEQIGDLGKPLNPESIIDLNQDNKDNPLAKEYIAYIFENNEFGTIMYPVLYEDKEGNKRMLFEYNNKHFIRVNDMLMSNIDFSYIIVYYMQNFNFTFESNDYENDKLLKELEKFAEKIKEVLTLEPTRHYDIKYLIHLWKTVSEYKFKDPYDWY